ncbi:MAG: saccharopine dehydrogenase C-terminal domain-containing protein, partial [Chitinophagaceae bacterium]
YGWINVIELSLTDETPVYQTDNKTLMDFFQEHFQQHNFQDWLQQIMQEQFHSSKKILQDLVGLIGMEEKRKELGDKEIDEFLMVNDAGSLEEVDVDDLKMTAAASVAEKMHDAKLTLKQLFYLGMNDKHTLIDKGICSAADVLQFALEEKLPLAPGDKDMVVMVHEIEWNKGSSIYRQASSMVVIGEDDVDTAMAKTVGLPLGIATKLILNGTIQRTGLCVPVYKDIYEPVLAELAKKGIIFSDTLTEC